MLSGREMSVGGAWTSWGSLGLWGVPEGKRIVSGNFKHACTIDIKSLVYDFISTGKIGKD